MKGGGKDTWNVFELLQHAERTGKPKPFHVTWIHSSFYRLVLDTARKKGTYFLPMSSSWMNLAAVPQGVENVESSTMKKTKSTRSKKSS